MKKMVDYTFDENVQDAMALAEMLKAIHHCPKPVIAKVHGAAFGGGVGLTAACDLAIALESATFSLSEVKLGLLPAVISPFVMEKIGSSAARRYFLTAERFDAIEAKRIGLISEVVTTPNEMDQWLAAVTQALIANGPEAVSACKRLIDDVNGILWPQVMDLTTRYIAERRIAPEGQEGMKAFLEKRPASWISEASSAHVS
jgi:methylglutaconyl-CoA hydratase